MTAALESLTIIHLPRATTVIVLPAGTAPLRFLGWTRRTEGVDKQVHGQ